MIPLLLRSHAILFFMSGRRVVALIVVIMACYNRLALIRPVNKNEVYGKLPCWNALSTIVESTIYVREKCFSPRSKAIFLEI